MIKRQGNHERQTSGSYSKAIVKLLESFCQLYTCHPTLAPTTGTSVNGSMGQESYKENIK